MWEGNALILQVESVSMTTRQLYNDLSGEAHLPTLHSTCPCWTLSIIVDCPEQSNMCGFVSPYVCVYVWRVCEKETTYYRFKVSIVHTLTQAVNVKRIRDLAPYNVTEGKYHGNDTICDTYTCKIVMFCQN